MKFNADKCEALHIEGKIPNLYMHTKLPSIAQEEDCEVTRDDFQENICFRPCCSQKVNYLALCKKTRTKPEIFYAAVQNNGLTMCPLYSSSLL